MSDWIDRVYDERKELRDKITKLKAFINESIIYEVLPQEKKDLLCEQLIAMNSYEDVLARRTLLE
jgi:hypothetical protein